MKKKQPEVIEWHNLKVGDFVESTYHRMFCFSFNKGISGPSCLGQAKNRYCERYYDSMDGGSYGGGGVMTYTRMKPSKAFIKLCRKLLEENFNKYGLDNLSYIEALAVLNKYDTSR